MGKEIITTKSVGYQFVDIPQEFVLDETARTKTVFKAEMHAGGVRGHVMRYRKNANGICEKLIPTNFNELHPDDGIKIDLPTNALKILLEKQKSFMHCWKAKESIMEKESMSLQIHLPY